MYIFGIASISQRFFKRKRRFYPVRISTNLICTRYFCRLQSFWYLGQILTFRIPWSMFVRSLSVLLFKFKYKFICFNLDLSNQLFLKQNSTKKIKAKTCQVCQSANLHIKHNIKRSGYVTFSIIAYKIPYRIPRLLHNFCTILK